MGCAWVVDVLRGEDQIMPRSGAVTLGELARQEGRTHLTIACKPCGRQGHYLVRRLLELHGDPGLPDVLAQLNHNCADHQNVAIHDRCRAVCHF